jgi:hypothetical protein
VVVETIRVDVTGFAPGVTVDGLKEIEVPPGSPATENVIGFGNELFCGVTVKV